MLFIHASRRNRERSRRGLLPVSRVLTIQSRPARDYAEAKERVERYKALDGDPNIIPAAYTKLYDSGQRTPLAVVLLHGITNHPGQFVQLAPLVHGLGANVFV